MMKNIIKNIAALIKVKTIISIICVAVFARLALTGAITPDNVMVVVSMVIAFYFGTQSEKKNGLDKAEATEYYVNEGDGNDRTIGY